MCAAKHEATFLHISDLNFRSVTDWDSQLLFHEFIQDIKKWQAHKNHDIDAILITGDIASSGKSDEYNVAYEMINIIRETTGIKEENLFLVPGNHDVDRNRITKHEEEIVQSILKAKSNIDDYFKTFDDFKIFLNKFEPYSKFLKNVNDKHALWEGGVAGERKPWYSIRTTIKGIPFRIIGLTTSLLASKEENVCDKIHVGLRQLKEVLDPVNADEFVIMLSHDPIESFYPEERKTIQVQTGKKNIVNFHGNSQNYQDAGNSIFPYTGVMSIAAGCLPSGSSKPCGYNLFRIDLDNHKFKLWPRRWSPDSSRWVADNTLSELDEEESCIVNLPFAARENIPRIDQDQKHLFEIKPLKVVKYPAAEFPTKLAVEQTAPLEIVIRAEKPAFAASTIDLNPRTGQREISVSVIVKAKGFEIVGNYFKEMLVPVEAVDSKPILFNLKAKQEGCQTIEVHFYQEGTYAGSLEIKTLIVAAEEQAGPPQNRTATTDWTFGEMPPESDLTLIIYERKSDPEFEYEILLSSTKLGIIFDGTGIIKFAGNPETKFREIFRDIERNDLPPNVIEESIKAKGLMLYEELFPNEFKNKYWQIRDRIDTIQLISHEPWVPWEIVRPWRCHNGTIEEDQFLCERFAFARWLSKRKIRKKERLETAKLVVPDDTYLSKALEERDWICELAKDIDLDVSIDQGYDEVLRSLRLGGFDLLHFSTHGHYDQAYPNMSGICLENGIELKPEHLSGVATSFGQANPLVILNACQTGASGFSLTGIGSWATRFIDAGASGFIGTLWSVTDETALRFTKSLYKQLSQGATLGQAVREARNRSRRKGDTSWLAYELYGHPNSHVKLGRR